MNWKRVILVLLLFGIAGAAVAQRFRGGGGWGRGLDWNDLTARDIARYEGVDAPIWTNRAGFEKDVFTFVRVRYDSRWGRGGGGGGWRTDVPRSDLFFSYRLQQVTSLKVHPDGRFIRLTDPELSRYPFIYMIEPGDLEFSEEEVKALRNYLLSGGFLMVDDFWGENEWDNFYYEIKRVFPDREPEELDVSHPIFSAVFPLPIKPQIPSVNTWRRQGVTYEGRDAQQVHYKAIHDDKGRMMAIICHNTDLGDGWEEEKTDPEYFRLFSEKYAYPMGINIIFYAMTH
jgi:hypothetical protein